MKKPSELFEDARSCVQCGAAMDVGLTDLMRFCTDPKCPNYGLIQIGIERMKRIKDAYDNSDIN
jgi:hypothetical protein